MRGEKWSVRVHIIQIPEQRGDISSVLECVCVCVWQLYRYVQESGRHNQHSTLSEQTEEERNPCRLSVWRQLELFFHSSFFQPVSPYPITCQEQIFRELTPTETHTHPQSPCQHTLSTSRSKHRLNARYQQASKILEVQWTHNKWKALINPHIAMWEQTGSDLKEKNMFWAQMSIFFFYLITAPGVWQILNTYGKWKWKCAYQQLLADMQTLYPSVRLVSE